MDEDTRPMLADLGLDRRDRVSAPVAEAKGKPCREDHREAAAIAADFDARKRRYDSGGVEGEDPRAARLRLWNTQASFEQDKITEQLENRWSGQDHRAGLNRNLVREVREDVIENRFGEERSRYLRERGRGSEDLATSRFPRSDGERSLHRPSNGYGHATTPPRFPGAYGPGPRDRVAVPTRTPRPDRAPSPRHFDTVCFNPVDHRHVANSVPHQTFAVQPVAPASATAKPVVNGSTTSSPTIIPLPPPSAGAATPNLTSTQAQQHYNQALWYVAQPNKVCDDYHQRFPDRKIYLVPARNRLVGEAILLADSGDENQTAAYLETHQDHQWTVEATRVTKPQLEKGDEAAIEEYWADHPRQKPFLDAAKAYYAAGKRKAATSNEEAVNGTGVSSSLANTAQSVPQPSSTSSHSAPTAHERALSDTSSNGVHSYSSDIVGNGDNTTIPSSPPTPLGVIAATLFDAAGRFLGVHHAHTSIPVQVTVNLTSRNAAFNPCDLIHHIDALAQSMADMSGGSADDSILRIDSLAGNMVDLARGAESNRKLEDMSLGDDGLWTMDDL